MAKTAVKPVFGWAYESQKGTINPNVFETKSDAVEFKQIYNMNFDGYKLVKVQISKYQPKKK